MINLDLNKWQEKETGGFLTPLSRITNIYSQFQHIYYKCLLQIFKLLFLHFLKFN